MVGANDTRPYPGPRVSGNVPPRGGRVDCLEGRDCRDRLGCRGCLGRRTRVPRNRATRTASARELRRTLCTRPLRTGVPCTPGFCGLAQPAQIPLSPTAPLSLHRRRRTWAGSGEWRGWGWRGEGVAARGGGCRSAVLPGCRSYGSIPQRRSSSSRSAGRSTGWVRRAMSSSYAMTAEGSDTCSSPRACPSSWARVLTRSASPATV